MPWTTPKTWVAGAVLPASDLNTHLRDQLNVLRAGGIEVPGAAVGAFVIMSSTTQLAVMTDVEKKIWSEAYT